MYLYLCIFVFPFVYFHLCICVSTMLRQIISCQRELEEAREGSDGYLWAAHLNPLRQTAAVNIVRCMYACRYTCILSVCISPLCIIFMVIANKSCHRFTLICFVYGNLQSFAHGKIVGNGKIKDEPLKHPYTAWLLPGMEIGE